MSQEIIEVKEVEYVYKSHNDLSQQVKALKGISISIEKGKFVVVIGRNGSGKSTFARTINSLIIPSNGAVYVNGLDSKDDKNVWQIRRIAGMVFQNPDNQIIGTSVEEDVAFGMENLGIEPCEIKRRVDAALETVNIKEFRERAPHYLSGGQKQRVAIAGVLAMRPECIILDEATSMLDPVGRKEVMNILKKLNIEENITIIHITHHMDETVDADRIIVIDDGKVALDGKPSDVFSQVERIKEIGLDVPHVIELIYELNKEGYNLPLNVCSTNEAVLNIAKLF